jgi:hypothetical protein
MFAGLHFWWAQRCALTALCVSLEQSPHTWERISTVHAKRNGLIVERYNDYASPFFNYYVVIRNGDKDTRLPRLWGRRVLRAMRKADRLLAYKAAVATLKPCNTPLQIENAKTR